jgi:hypothetical protein
MKKRGRPQKAFFKAWRNLSADVSSHLVNLGRGTAFRSVPGQAIVRAGRKHALPIVAMSSGRLFLNGLLASIARLRFTSIIRLKRLPARMESFTIER